jgi:hypothetical protein
MSHSHGVHAAQYVGELAPTVSHAEGNTTTVRSAAVSRNTGVRSMSAAARVLATPQANITRAAVQPTVSATIGSPPGPRGSGAPQAHNYNP